LLRFGGGQPRSGAHAIWNGTITAVSGLDLSGRVQVVNVSQHDGARILERGAAAQVADRCSAGEGG